MSYQIPRSVRSPGFKKMPSYQRMDNAIGALRETGHHEVADWMEVDLKKRMIADTRREAIEDYAHAHNITPFEAHKRLRRTHRRP